MKSILPWIVVVLALGGVVVLYTANQSKSAEVTRLQAELQELAGLRMEVEELKKNQVPADELTRLRKNTEDLIRLRNTVRQLNDDKSQLAKQSQIAQTEIQRAQSQAQAAQAQAQAAQAQATAAAQAQAQGIATNALAGMTPEQRQAFEQRYGVAGGERGVQDPVKAQANACINNLRQIDSAMQQWALENGKTEQAIPTSQDVATYIKGNAIPKCPAGGVYTINSVATLPTCTIPGHALPH